MDLGLTIIFISSVLPAASSALTTSSSFAPRSIFNFSIVGSTWLTFALLRFIPVIFLGPVIKMKFLSIRSTMMHLRPISLPAIFVQILPIYIAGIDNYSRNFERDVQLIFISNGILLHFCLVL